MFSKPQTHTGMSLLLAGASGYWIAYIIVLQVHGALLSPIHSQSPFPSSFSASLLFQDRPLKPLILPQLHAGFLYWPLALPFPIPVPHLEVHVLLTYFPLTLRESSRTVLVQRCLLLSVLCLWTNLTISCPFMPHPFPRALDPWVNGCPLKPPSETQG